MAPGPLGREFHIFAISAQYQTDANRLEWICERFVGCDCGRSHPVETFEEKENSKCQHRHTKQNCTLSSREIPGDEFETASCAFGNMFEGDDVSSKNGL